jgi:hypothetical protein
LPADGGVYAGRSTPRGERLARQQNARKFRDPDRLAQPEVELRRLVPDYHKVSDARALGPRLGLTDNRSRSFVVFVAGVPQLAAHAERTP